MMINKADYSKYECPYSHLKKDVGHELKGPEGYENTYGVWCACGFNGPMFYLDPEELRLKLKQPPAPDPYELHGVTREEVDELVKAVELIWGYKPVQFTFDYYGKAKMHQHIDKLIGKSWNSIRRETDSVFIPSLFRPAPYPHWETPIIFGGE